MIHKKAYKHQRSFLSVQSKTVCQSNRVVMIVKVVILMCFVLSTHAKPISVHDVGHYVTAAPTYSYAPAPLRTYAIPKISAPIISTPIVPAPIIAPVYHTPVIKQVEPEPYDPNPQYSYSYGVNDPETGDNKHAEETLQDGVVHGSYSLTEPDGTIRRVAYTADKVNGFNAVVEKHGTATYVKPLKYVAPTVAKYVAPAPVYHAPVAKYVAPPTAYSAPVAPATVYQAPVAKYVAPAAVYHAPVAKIVAPTAYHAPVYASYHGYH
ncbi:Cuticle protein [Pseudolycoriella hygida]|uniref:Cuticle protein n=1 Tax=Pseudolycoriella hygida TaxID=35572 RepID=A0A9Q0MN95_9DIPT|nr:Cuticle protein [Pseudolycoriella hygida]